MRLYRCSACACGFAIVSGQKKPGNVSCPLCKAEPDKVIELDLVESAGAHLAGKALAFWRSLPSGD